MKGWQLSPAGQSPPHVGKAALPHKVAPIGAQVQELNGGLPWLVHASAAGQLPLQTGAVPPQGSADDTQVQVERSCEAHTEPAGQAPPHSGKTVSPHGVRPLRLVSEQSASVSVVAFFAT